MANAIINTAIAIAILVTAIFTTVEEKDFSLFSRILRAMKMEAFNIND